MTTRKEVWVLQEKQTDVILGVYSSYAAAQNAIDYSFPDSGPFGWRVTKTWLEEEKGA